MGVQVGIIPNLILRDAMAEDPWGTTEKVAELGFQGVESGMLIQGDVAENKKRLDDLGLKAIALGAKKDVLSDGLDDLAEKAKVLDCKYIVTYWGPCDSVEQVKADVEAYDAIGAQCRTHGLKFCYHNHDHEFKTIFDDQRAIDVMMAHSDPEHLFFELDVAWVQYGGDDPIAFMNQHAARIPIVHLKDVADLDERGRFTSIGTGCVDINGVMQAATDLGMAWAIVEQDRVNRLTPMESVQASALNLKEWGWI